MTDKTTVSEAKFPVKLRYLTPPPQGGKYVQCSYICGAVSPLNDSTKVKVATGIVSR